MAGQPSLLDLLGARWALGSAVAATAWSGGCAGFALADGTVALAPVPWPGAPALRGREGGGVELVPGRGLPPPLARTSVSRGPCRALAGGPDGFLAGCSDGRLRRLLPDGAASRVARFDAPVDAAVTTGATPTGWACVAGGRVHGEPTPGGGSLAGAVGLAWHRVGGLAVAHAGGVTLCRGEHVEHLPGDAPGAPALAFSPDGRWLVAGPALWRLSPHPPVGTPVALPGLSEPPAASSFSADNSLLASAGPGGVHVWRLGDEGPPTPVAWGAGGRDAVALAFHPRRPLLAAAFANGAVLLGPPGGHDVLLLRSATGESATGAGAACALAFEAAGAWLALGGADGECALLALPDLLFRAGEARPAANTMGEAP